MCRAVDVLWSLVERMMTMNAPVTPAQVVLGLLMLLFVDNRFTRLSSLIEEELSERGHLDQFLDRLTDLTSQAASEQCVVSGPGASQPVAKSVCAGSTDSSLSPTCSNTVDADAQNSESPLDIAASTSLAIASEASSASAAPPAAASHSAQHGPITNRADVDSNVVAAGPSVLEAAVAAYKQEKRQLWKASFH